MDCLEQLSRTVDERLHVYRWWEPDMALPALHWWLVPGETEYLDACTVHDHFHPTATIAVKPGRSAGADMKAAETFSDSLRAAFDPVLIAPRPWGIHSAARTGINVTTDKLGAGQVLGIEHSFECVLERSVSPIASPRG